MKAAVKFLSALTPAMVLCSSFTWGYQKNFKVTGSDIHNGIIYEKVWLDHYALPAVKLVGASYNAAQLPEGVLPGPQDRISIKLGMERKRPFAVIMTPAYKTENGLTNCVTELVLDITEQPALSAHPVAAKTTSINSSLASGTWYKIGITKTGLYKLDAAFFSSMGISPSSIDPANIRILGNGGNMLSENNAIPRISDLAENDIMVNDGGDNTFNNGDYVVFYGVGPTTIVKDSLLAKFRHISNLYSDTAYYFISVNSGAGNRVQVQASAPAANTTASGFDHFDYYEADLVNPTGYSKTWLGEKFSPDINITTKSLTFDLGSNIANLNCRVAFACTQLQSNSSVSVALNGSTIGTAYFNSLTVGDQILTKLAPEWTVPVNSSSANFTITFNAAPLDPAAKGYLDFVEINGRRGLSLTGNQMSFRDWQTTGPGKVTSYPLGNANGFTRVWDVTDPQKPIQMAGILSGSTYTFSQDAGKLHEFVAMNGDALYTPYYVGPVANQNLHGAAPAKLIIVTVPAFLPAAQKLADFHMSHDNISSLIVTTEQVYNEFSSGAQDISAIRDFIRYQYKNADTNTAPKYLLIFGSASYDYKHRLSANCNLVPTFEAANDSNDINSFLSDDFYGFLDDTENIEDETVINALDIGIGRISARNATVANDVVNKIIHYKSTATLGPWRLGAMFAADNRDGAGFHLEDAETMASTVTTTTGNLYNEQKVYLDVIPVTTTPAGDRCPNANTAINDQIYKGTFMLNYNGHGRYDLLAHERILTSDDYNEWSNINKLPFMVTATCDFGQFDHPEFISAAEQLLFDTKGGVIAMITTTQAVFSTYNRNMNQEFLASQFTKKADGTWNTFGDAVRIGKNLTYLYSHSESELANFRKWALLGDPALTPDFPENKVVLDSIIDGVTMEPADTVRALGKYILKGTVRDLANSLMSTFNGTLTVSFYDKPRTLSFATSGGYKRFQLQDNLIYKGKVTVVNGRFELTFITPRDINYFFGSGKISLYAENGTTDAAGMDTTIAIGGFSANPVENDIKPTVGPYINDSSFINGGITGTNTSLFVVLRSETGINVSGYSVGHDLVAILDNNIESPYILNDYYETAPNTFQLGYVKFPVSGLADGLHTFKVKAWDVNNNPGEGEVDFMVINGQVMVIDNLGNYPNPFSGTTHFVFEHNHPDEQLDVQIAIFDIAGSMVRTIRQSFTPSGSRTADMTWDGTDNSGSQLPSGVYVYRVNITTEKGFKSTAYQKLVITR